MMLSLYKIVVKLIGVTEDNKILLLLLLLREHLELTIINSVFRLLTMNQFLAIHSHRSAVHASSTDPVSSLLSLHHGLQCIVPQK